MNEIEKQIENINKEKEKSILELLKDEKVEWRKLENIAKTSFWLMPATPKYQSSGISYITSKNIINGNISFEDVKYISNEDFKKISKNREILENDILITMIGKIGEVAIVKEKMKFYGQNMYLVRLNNEKILNEYYCYYITSFEAQKKLVSAKNNSTQGYIKAGAITNLEIPIPRIEIQEKIVKILDKFTKYVTELQAELQARNKQYIYYRDLLLSEDYLTKLTQETTPKPFLLIWEELANIIKIKNGRDWKNLGEGNIPVYGSGGEMGVCVDKMAYNKPTVLIPRKGSIENVFYLDKPFWNVDTIFYTEINEEKIIPKYFYYFIQSFNIKSLSTDSTRPSITQTALNKIKIPLPPIEIQEKVVLVLDKFQKLVDETNGLLPEEIEQRKKQYEYYREKLLTFDLICDTSKQASKQASLISNKFFDLLYEAGKIVDVDLFDKVQYKTLGEIGQFVNGNGMPKTMFDENGVVGAIHYGHIYTQYNHFVDEPIVKISEENSKKLKKVNYGDLVIAKTSENIEDVMKTVAYLGKDEVVAGGHSVIYKHNQNPKYMSYLLNGSKNIIKQKNKMCRGVKVIELSSGDMEKIKVPIPPMEVQNHIVDILDKFHNLVNDISCGLPKEIELREKQYIYYREKLLDFPKD